MTKVKDFFSDMKAEAKRIRWCKGKQLVKSVTVTLLTIIFFAGFFYLIDLAVAFIKTLV